MTKEEMLKVATFGVHQLRYELIQNGFTVFPIKEVKLSTRCTRRFGQCAYHRNVRGEIVKVTITISSICFHNTKNCLRDTILHELCHAMPDCQNHREVFHYNAKKVMKLYDDCHIDTYCSHEEDKISHEYIKSIGRDRKQKYRVTCKHCGRNYYYKKQTELVRLLKAHKETKTYTCGKCRGHDFKLEVI